MNANKKILPVERQNLAGFSDSIVNRKSKIVNGFTLIELLVVISIIALLAAFLFPAMGVIEKNKFITRTKAEMGQVAGAIDAYKDKWGFYPPDNKGNALTNQLFYELVGTTYTPPATFQTLDNSATVTTAQLNGAFGTNVNAFINCTKPGADEQAAGGRNFLHEYRPGQITTYSGVNLLVASVGGPETNNYAPLTGSTANPWRYVSTNPVNNPGSYDLWVQLQISGKTYLICNWTKQVQVNNTTWR